MQHTIYIEKTTRRIQGSCHLNMLPEFQCDAIYIYSVLWVEARVPNRNEISDDSRVRRHGSCR